MKEHVKRLSIKLVPYLIIFIASIFATYILFYKGLPGGDDILFHLSMSNELLYGFNHGFALSSPSHITLGGVGYYTSLFYGPLSHTSTALVAFLFSWAGVDIIIAYKIVMFLGVFISAVFSFLLAKKMSTNVYIGLISALLYTFLPYRLFSLFCRAAFGEVMALAFIPMLFYSLYRILNDTNIKVSPFICLISGTSLLILSHPFTAVSTLTFAFIYLIFNIKKLISKVKKLKVIVYSLISIILVIGLVGFYVFPLFSAEASNYYRITADPSGVWTTVEHVADSTANSDLFSGFIKVEWLNANFPGATEQIYIASLLFIITVIACIICDYFIKKAPKSIYYRFVVDFVVILLPVLFIIDKLELTLALIIFYILFVFLMTLKDYIKPVEISENKSLKIIYKDLDLYFGLFGIISTMILIYVPDIWSYIPSIYLSTQFSWRLWGLFSFFVAFFIYELLTYLIKDKQVILSSFAIASFLLILSQGTLEKRLQYDKNPNIWYQEGTINEVFMQRIKTIGAMNEYAPQCFYDDNYTPTYPQGHYYTIKSILRNRGPFFYNVEGYPLPIAIEGEGTSEVIEMNSPDMTFKINASIDSIYQLPQLYYEGYNLKLIDGENNITYQTTFFADGLIAFNVPKGEYDAILTYVGTTTYKVWNVFFYISIAGVVVFASYEFIVNKFKKEKPENV
jgi:hypothetical protein